MKVSDISAACLINCSVTQKPRRPSEQTEATIRFLPSVTAITCFQYWYLGSMIEQANKANTTIP
jgi:hypothetical protein